MVSAADRPAGTDPVVRLDGVAVQVRRTPVLRGLDLVLGAGEVLGVLGANGSGKTTLLRVLATLVTPTAGRGEVLGRALGSPAVTAARPGIALVGHHPALYPRLTLRENLRFVADLTGRDGAAAGRALGEVGLSAAADRRAEACSLGMQRRCELARVLMARPVLVLLDEVHAGLDTDAVGLVDEVLTRTRRRGGAGVLVSHDAARLAATADRVVRIVHGAAEPVAAAPVRSAR